MNRDIEGDKNRDPGGEGEVILSGCELGAAVREPRGLL